MNIIEEYKKQFEWRNWHFYLEKLPVSCNDTILDLGGGIGDVSLILSKKAFEVICIDSNAHLLNYGKENNSKENITYFDSDLREVDKTDLPMADGIWASFSAAYFPDFSPILDQWLSKLKPNGWIALVEINDLFGHRPLPIGFQNKLKSYYEKQRENNIYDFEMGSKLKGFLEEKNISILLSESIKDKEFAFNGKAQPEILTAWEGRLNRMMALQEHFGLDAFADFKEHFLNLLDTDEHYSVAEINFVIGRKYVCEHEANHRGQIQWLISRLPETRISKE